MFKAAKHTVIRDGHAMSQPLQLKDQHGKDEHRKDAQHNVTYTVMYGA
jgi:hypothetical protein